MRGISSTKPVYGALLDANNLAFNQYCTLKPKNLQEIIEKVAGTGERTIRHMLNVGPRNEVEASILNYYIWSVAASRIRAENNIAKLHSTKRKTAFDETGQTIDFD